MVVHEHQRLRRHALHEKDVGSDGAAGADHRIAAHDGGVGVNGDPVFDGWVPLLSAERLAGGQGAGHEADALIQLHPVADDGGLADHRPGAMVDKEMVSDAGARVDVHAGPAVGPLSHDARQEWHVAQVQGVGQSVHRDGLDERVGHDDFLAVGRGGIA